MHSVILFSAYGRGHARVSKTSWISIQKTFYDNLMIIIKAGGPYLNKVNLKWPLHFINKAPHPK